MAKLTLKQKAKIDKLITILHRIIQAKHYDDRETFAQAVADIREVIKDE